MADRQKIGLDNPAFSGRLRQPLRRSHSVLPPALTVRPHAQNMPPAEPPASALPEPVPPPAVPEIVEKPIEPEVPQSPLPLVKPEPFARPAQPKMQPSNVLRRQLVRMPDTEAIIARLNSFNLAKPQLALIGLAAVTFLVGLVVSLQTINTNQATVALVAGLAGQTTNSGSGPNTTKPDPDSLGQYVVAADLGRYLKIPSFDTTSRILQLGMKSNGALSVPESIFDTAWYTGSAKPGQPGATLIYGYSSGDNVRGALYGAKNLAAGDVLQIVRGDGSAVNYRVVQSRAYSSSNVDMQAAMNAVTPGKSGLNLLIYGGQQGRGSAQFSQRVIVFAEQI